MQDTNFITSRPAFGQAKNGQAKGEAPARLPRLTEAELALEFHGRSQRGGEEWDGHAFLFDTNCGEWRTMFNGLWGESSPLALQTMLMVAMGPGEGNQDRRSLWRFHSLSGALKICAIISGMRRTQWDTNDLALCCPGGWVNLENGKYHKGESPQQYFTMQALVSPKAGDPELWLECLDLWTGGDADLIAYLQQMAGYCLTGLTREHALLWLAGGGENGKTSFVSTLQTIMGTYATTLPMESLLKGRESSVPADIARLAGKRLAVAGELGTGSWNLQRIKQLTGGDTIAARFMRENFFDFRPKVKLLISGNDKPSLASVDRAIERRLHLVPFTHKISNPDKKIPKRLEKEFPQILAWAMRGTRMWLEAGELQRAGVVQRSSNEYLTTQDVLGEWLADCCDVDPNAQEAAGVLYASYRSWCDTHGYRTLSARSLGTKLGDRGYESKRTMNQRMRIGLRLRPQPEAETYPADRYRRSVDYL